MRRPSGTDRAVSPVISVILMVAITVILAAVIATFVLGLGEDVENPGPTVGESSGELVGGTGSDSQLVRITHVAGERVDVENMEIVVDAPECDPSRARIVDLPVEGNTGFDSGNFQYGGALIDKSNPDNGVIGGEWDFGVLHADTSNTFEAGDFFEFRLNAGGCRGGSGLQAGDTVTVRVIHEPTNAVVIDKEFRVT